MRHFSPAKSSTPASLPGIVAHRSNVARDALSPRLAGRGRRLVTVRATRRTRALRRACLAQLDLVRRTKRHYNGGRYVPSGPRPSCPCATSVHLQHGGWTPCPTGDQCTVAIEVLEETCGFSFVAATGTAGVIICAASVPAGIVTGARPLLLVRYDCERWRICRGTCYEGLQCRRLNLSFGCCRRVSPLVGLSQVWRLAMICFE